MLPSPLPQRHMTFERQAIQRTRRTDAAAKNSMIWQALESPLRSRQTADVRARQNVISRILQGITCNQALLQPPSPSLGHLQPSCFRPSVQTALQAELHNPFSNPSRTLSELRVPGSVREVCESVVLRLLLLPLCGCHTLIPRAADEVTMEAKFADSCQPLVRYNTRSPLYGREWPRITAQISPSRAKTSVRWRCEVT